MASFRVWCELYTKYIWRLLEGKAARLSGIGVKNSSIPLHYDVLYLINKNLDWHDRFFLSQTCRALREFAWCDWNDRYQSLNRKEQIQFLAGLAIGMPGHWFCAACLALHPVNTSDTPDGAHRVIGNVCSGRDPTPVMELFEYQIHHRHIQLALKYNRMGSRKKYLKELLAPTPQQNLFGHQQSTYFAQPRIIENQFLLYECRKFRIPFRQLWVRELVGWVNIRLCPHLILPPLDRPFRASYNLNAYFRVFQLEAAIGIALGNTSGKEVRSSCACCLTDFAVFFDQVRNVLILKSWRNFGSFGSPEDEPWVSHILRWENDEFRNGVLDRRLGSIREIYRRGGNQRTGSVTAM